MNIVHVIGARPNFMKAAPMIFALDQKDVKQQVVHTGQHYDDNMSVRFFKQLGIPTPDHNLEVGSGGHAVQTAQIMIRFENKIIDNKPDFVLVYGDVNSTVAAALVCAKINLPFGHVEAGLRSFDRTMPEEVNRVVTDQLADLLFTPSADGDENLKKEGVGSEKIFLVGNLMIDTLIRLLPKAAPPRIPNVNNPYILVTLHRPSNVDKQESLLKIMGVLEKIGREVSVVFAVHPRTKKFLSKSKYDFKNSALVFTEPLGYLEFLGLQRNATAVITDSGGIQEETTFLGVPCLTVRENTERPITVEIGTNILVGHNMDSLYAEVKRILAGKAKKGKIPPLWDGKAAHRAAEILTSN